jgi:hypothetical protein
MHAIVREKMDKQRNAVGQQAIQNMAAGAPQQ